jgi:hypothetical protein
MLVWPMAAKAPSAIEAMAMNTTICCQSAVMAGNGWMTTRMNTAMAAILGAAAKNAVTGVGAPS